MSTTISLHSTVVFPIEFGSITYDRVVANMHSCASIILSIVSNYCLHESFYRQSISRSVMRKPYIVENPRWLYCHCGRRKITKTQRNNYLPEKVNTYNNNYYILF